MIRNHAKNPGVCILAVNSNPTFWQKSLIAGKFETPPAVRLMGIVGKKRAGTEKEIAMWENVLKGEKGLIGERIRFPSDRFFQNNKLTPYGEVEILRKFVFDYKSLELYISAPRALDRAADVMRFLDEQRIEYKTLRCVVVIDSAERFEYKFSK